MDLDGVSPITITHGRITRLWGLEDTWTRVSQRAGERGSENSSFS
jgi:hypothetical protein